MNVIRDAIRLLKPIYFGVLIVLDIIINVFKCGPLHVFQWKQTERPKCLDDPSLGKHGYLKLKDVRIHYVANGPIKGALMLFLHGFPEFWYSWRHQIREFSKDYRVVTVDMRGYGESDKPVGLDAYHVKVLMQDVKGIIEALGYESCTLVAHDWGGLVAYPFAKFYPDYVERLILLNIAPLPILKAVFSKSKKQQERFWYVTFFQLPWLPELRLKVMNFAALRDIFIQANITDTEDINAYVYNFSEPGALTPPINYYRALGQRSRVSYDVKCDMPVLVIWGCQDNYLDVEIVDVIAQMAPEVTIKRVVSANHFVAMEEPEVVNTLMREWLKQDD